MLKFVLDNVFFRPLLFSTMNEHTTNYIDTFIEVADDCPASGGEIPPAKSDKKSVARLQYDLIAMSPYRYTSDDILFLVFTERNTIAQKDWRKAREEFFSKGQACLRSSPLTKRYGWGIHCNEAGKIALYGRQSQEYQKWVNDKNLKKVKAMRSTRK